MFASSRNRVSIVRELLQRGAPPDACNNDGSTALAEACCLDHIGTFTSMPTSPFHATSLLVTFNAQMQPLSYCAMARVSTCATSLSTLHS
jgi:hypothetical protein